MLIQLWNDFISGDIQYILRILVACICGFAIGYERKNRAKGAGVRTHLIVAAASALMMIISKYGFTDIASVPGIKEADPSRLASQIVTGVGFLGAGMIFIQKQIVTGLTTAAGIWATSGIGMALGAGMYSIGIAFTVIIILSQLILHTQVSWLQNTKLETLYIYGVDEKDFQKTAVNKLDMHGIKVGKINVNKDAQTGKKDYYISMEVNPKVSEDDIIDLFSQYTCKLRVNE
ncbi:MAG: MgtC/SapB family protein [Clostridia bacterium]|nr:MgtC/SapB family protein [Clostridia bacterium]